MVAGKHVRFAEETTDNMKKLMIAILILVPIVILLATNIATSVITTNVYINVERVELNEEEVTVSLNADGSPYVFEDLKAIVYPTGARNKTVIWTIEDVQFDDPLMETSDTPIATVSESGVVTVVTYGVFTVVATTEDGNKIATCRFISSGNEVTSLRINDVANTSFYAGETQQLEAVILSVDAEDKRVLWEIEGTAFRVDGNGIVTAVEEGSARVRATSVAKPEFYAEIELTCVVSDFKYTELTTSRTTIPLSLLLNGSTSGITTQNCSVSGDNLVIDSYPATLTKNGRTLTVRRCEPGAITLENVSYFSSDEFFIRVGGQGLSLKAVYCDGLEAGTPSVSWSSSSTDAATVSQNGFVTAVSTGETEISVTSGSQSYSLHVRVITPTTRVALNALYTASRDKLGIGASRVFGTKYAVGSGTETVNYVDLQLSLPSNWIKEAFVWSTSDTTLAWFENEYSNRLYFTEDSFDGKKQVTVTVSARYPLYQSVTPKASYTFTLIDGVNVYTLDETARYARAGFGLALHNDIGLTQDFYSAQPSGIRGLHIYKNLYGNGHAVYRVLADNNEETGWEDCIVWVSTSDVTVENTTIRFGITDDEISREKGTMAYARRRWGFRAAIDDKDSEGNDVQVTNVTVRWCTMENAYNCAITQHAEVNFYGCIFRNTPSAGLLLYSAFEDVARNTYLENCVFSNSTCVPICTMIDNSTINSDIAFEQIPELYGFKVNTISFGGFLDVYNWIYGEGQNGVPLFTVTDDIAGSVGLDRELMQGLINNLLGNYLRTKDEYASLRFNINGHLYFHAGAIIMGGNLPTSRSTVSGVEEVGYLLHEVPIPDFVSAATNFRCPVYLMSYNSETYDVSPDDLVDYSENSKLFEELRNGRVKSTQE